MRIKKIDKELDDIGYQTEKSAGIDLYSRIDTIIPANSAKLIPLNVVVETEEGCMTALLPRSSLFKKKGLILANSVGVIDRDYCGDNDEIMAMLLNMSIEPVSISKNERICQMIVIQIKTPEIEFVDSMDNEDRGGFGSTDK